MERERERERERAIQSEQRERERERERGVDSAPVVSMLSLPADCLSLILGSLPQPYLRPALSLVCRRLQRLIDLQLGPITPAVKKNVFSDRSLSEMEQEGRAVLLHWFISHLRAPWPLPMVWRAALRKGPIDPYVLASLKEKGLEWTPQTTYHFLL